MRMSISLCIALTVSLFVAESASAQVIVSPWGGLGVRVATPTVGFSSSVRSVYTGGTVRRVGRVGLGTRSMHRHVVTPHIVTTPHVVVGAGRLAPVVGLVGSSSHLGSPHIGSITNADFLGDWRVYASHVTATMTLASAGYGLTSPGHREVGVWSWHGSRNLLGGNSFVLKLNSSQGGSTTFEGQWIVPGRKFQMTSLNSGLTYTVVRTY